MLISVAVAVIASTLTVPLIIALCKKYNWYDSVDARKVHQGAVPRLGGLAVFAAYLIALLLHIFVFSSDSYFFAVPFFIGGALIFAAGIADDFCNLRARIKFVIQIVAILIVCTSPLFFKKFLGFDIPPFIGRVLTFFWILLLVNAYNLIDGLDWLCGGLSLLTLFSLGLFMYFTKASAAGFCFILCAALTGFLIFNRPPARIFLGDGGSQTLGFMIATLPLLNHSGVFENTKPLVMLLLASIPVLDVIAAVWRRGREHRSFFSTDRAHIHHKLINIGFSKKGAVFFLLMLQMLICVSALSTLYLSQQSATIVLFIALLFVITFFCIIHYVNRSVNLKLRGHLDAAPQAEH